MATRGSVAASDDGPAPNDSTARRKQSLFSAISNRPMHLKYAWDLYHEKNIPSSKYEERLSTQQADIITVQMFWQAYRRIDFARLQWKESIHFFKRQIRPVWEDSRNRDGGAWYFRFPDRASRTNSETQKLEEYSPAQEFFESVCMAAVGQHIDIAIKGSDPTNRLSDDDLCGVSLSKQDRSCLVTVWNRRGSNLVTRQEILQVVLRFAPQEAKRLLDDVHTRDKDCYYKKHSEHKGFDAVMAQTARVEDSILSPDNEVKPEEREAVLAAVMADSGLVSATSPSTGR